MIIIFYFLSLHSRTTMIISFYLVSYVSSETLVTSQYRKNECEGVPSSIVVFEASDLDSPEPNGNETWPSTYTLGVNDNTYGFCGTLPIDLQGGCCNESLDLVESAGYLSFVTLVSDSAELDSAVLRSTNKKSYCQLLSRDGSSLFGYQQYLVLADGTCVDDHFVCSAKGTLQVFQENLCVGNVTTITESDPTDALPLLGNVRFSMTTFQKAYLDVFWVTYVPGRLLVPEFKSPIDISGFVGFILSILVAVITFLIQLIRYTNMKSGFNRIQLICSFLWMLWLPILMVYYYYQFETNLEVAVTAEFMFATRNLATLFSVFLVNNLINHAYNLPRTLTISLYVITLLIHIGLAGSDYFAYLRAFSGPWLSPLQKWKKAHSYWIIFLIFWLLIPPLAIAIKQVSRNSETSIRARLTKISQVDSTLAYFLAVEFICCFGYYFIDSISDYSNFLRNDRAALSIGGPQNLCLMILAALQYRIAETIKKTITRGSQENTGKATTRSPRSKSLKPVPLAAATISQEDQKTKIVPK